jgi:hypothetical protein
VIGLRQNFLVDAWFHGHMHEAIKQFLEAVKDGIFLGNGVFTDPVKNRQIIGKEYFVLKRRNF